MAFDGASFAAGEKEPRVTATVLSYTGAAHIDDTSGEALDGIDADVPGTYVFAIVQMDSGETREVAFKNLEGNQPPEIGASISARFGTTMFQDNGSGVKTIHEAASTNGNAILTFEDVQYASYEDNLNREATSQNAWREATTLPVVANLIVDEEKIRRDRAREEEILRNHEFYRNARARQRERGQQDSNTHQRNRGEGRERGNSANSNAWTERGAYDDHHTEHQSTPGAADGNTDDPLRQTIEELNARIEELEREREQHRMNAGPTHQQRLDALYKSHGALHEEWKHRGADIDTKHRIRAEVVDDLKSSFTSGGALAMVADLFITGGAATLTAAMLGGGGGLLLNGQTFARGNDAKEAQREHKHRMTQIQQDMVKIHESAMGLAANDPKFEQQSSGSGMGGPGMGTAAA